MTCHHHTIPCLTTINSHHLHKKGPTLTVLKVSYVVARNQLLQIHVHNTMWNIFTSTWQATVWNADILHVGSTFPCLEPPTSTEAHHLRNKGDCLAWSSVEKANVRILPLLAQNRKIWFIHVHVCIYVYVVCEIRKYVHVGNQRWPINIKFGQQNIFSCHCT